MITERIAIVTVEGESLNCENNLHHTKQVCKSVPSLGCREDNFLDQMWKK